jgi:glucan 1,3-beta-glucosidase
VGALAAIDASATDTDIFLRTSQESREQLAGSIVLKNVTLTRVPVAIHVSGGPDVLPGTTETKVIDSWAQGNVYTGTRDEPIFTQGELKGKPLARSLLDEHGHVYGKQQPQYEHCNVDEFVSVKAHGARGDGKSDDTVVIQHVLDKVRPQYCLDIENPDFLLPVRR